MHRARKLLNCLCCFLKVLLHDLVILFQEGVQLSDKLIGICLSLLDLLIQSSNFLVEKFRYLGHIDEVTVFILGKVDF